MQRKPSFPVANCSIKMPDMMSAIDMQMVDDDGEQHQRRQQLINFGHSQWGFNNWSWSVKKQDLDFVDFANGKYCAGVVAYVSVSVKSFDIHRENIGYATSMASTKGLAIHKSRKCAVTNALRETLLGFGGNVATDLLELLESRKSDVTPAPEPQLPENNQNIANKPAEVKNARKEPETPANSTSRHTPIKNAPVNPPIAKTHPMPASLPANRPQPRVPAGPAPRSNDPRPLEEMGEEEARAERKRRQRQAQEEFRQRQMMKGNDEKPEHSKANSSNSGFDKMLLDIPTQDIDIEETGGDAAEAGKRRSPSTDTSATKRRPGVMSKLDIESV